MRKILAFTLVMILALSMSVIPAHAQFIDWSTGKELVTLKTSSGKSVLAEPKTSHETILLYSKDGGKVPQYTPTRHVTSENVIGPKEKITIKNVSGELLSVWLKARPYIYTGELYASGFRDSDGEMLYSFNLREDGCFGGGYENHLANFKLKPGQSKTFDFSKFVGTGDVEMKLTEGAYITFNLSVVNEGSDFYDLTEYEYVIKRTGDLTPVAPEEEVVSDDPNDMVRISKEADDLTDDGYTYSFDVTNTTDEPMTGYYALLTYYPNKLHDKFSGEDFYSAEINIFEVNIPVGETMENKISSSYSLTNSENMWVKFENKAEMESFIKQKGLYEIHSHYSDRYGFTGAAGESILYNTFDVTFNPAKK